jgi:hypothetical protein
MIGRRATRISHAGSDGSQPRAPFVGRLIMGRPANDNAPPRRPLGYWVGFVAYSGLLAVLGAVIFFG